MINRILEKDMFLKNNSMFHSVLDHISKRCTVHIDNSIYEFVEIDVCNRETYIVHFDCGYLVNVMLSKDNLSDTISKIFGNNIIGTCDYIELKKYF